MLLLEGTVQNLFHQPGSTDRKTGEVIPSRHRVQLIGASALQNGQQRLELVTLTVEDPGPWEPLVGAQVRVPVGVFAAGGGGLQYFLRKGSRPEAL